MYPLLSVARVILMPYGLKQNELLHRTTNYKFISKVYNASEEALLGNQ